MAVKRRIEERIRAVGGGECTRTVKMVGSISYGPYRDVPMDCADASQVAVASRERLEVIFTLDGDFRSIG